MSDAENIEPTVTEDGKRKDEIQTEETRHETLKYSLLGPSLLKAGQDMVDQDKVRCLGHRPVPATRGRGKFMLTC